MGGYTLYQSSNITVVGGQDAEERSWAEMGALRCRSIRVALRAGKDISLGYGRVARIPTNNEHVNE